MVTKVTEKKHIPLKTLLNSGGQTMESFDTNRTNHVTIGYYDDTAVYLLPTETWHEMQKYCLHEGTHFPFSKSTFFKMLMDRGAIAPTKDGQPTIQKKINGTNHRVLKLTSGGIVEYFVTSVTDEITN